MQRTVAAIRAAIERLVAVWQQQLGDEIEVHLGGSLVSGLALIDEDTAEVDADIVFLVERPLDDEAHRRVCHATGLPYIANPKTAMVRDWPEGESEAIKMKSKIELPEMAITVVLDILIRSRAYVGWHRFYSQVFTPEELEIARQEKRRLIGLTKKSVYRAFKQQMLQEAQRRVVSMGLLPREGIQ